MLELLAPLMPIVLVVLTISLSLAVPAFVERAASRFRARRVSAPAIPSSAVSPTRDATVRERPAPARTPAFEPHFWADRSDADEGVL